MKNGTGKKDSASSASETEHETGSLKMPGPVMQFAAARASELADSLYEHAKNSIDRAQRSVPPLDVETIWQRAQPLLVRTGEFVRRYPWRAGTIVALLAGAAYLTRTPGADGVQR
ncbi:MAG: hypothetical protein ACT4PZ_16660 [Panacagrimonas sp.]